MVTVRLSRGGARGRPFYHFVVCDSRRSRDGRYIERLGFFNPIATSTEERLRVDLGRLDYWTGVGARVSERVDALVKDYRKQQLATAA
jgi:small subunit ribosomal protein S16